MRETVKIQSLLLLRHYPAGFTNQMDRFVKFISLPVKRKALPTIILSDCFITIQQLILMMLTSTNTTERNCRKRECMTMAQDFTCLILVDGAWWIRWRKVTEDIHPTIMRLIIRCGLLMLMEDQQRRMKGRCTESILVFLLSRISIRFRQFDGCRRE